MVAVYYSNVNNMGTANGGEIYLGSGNLSLDPLFADAGNNDFHLKSAVGRWNGSTWVTTDTTTSWCVDAGDPSSAYSNEPSPNGGRINMGAYGNTAYASKSDDRMIIYVDSSNTTSPWLGTEDDPYKTIQDGIDRVRSCGIVYVKYGAPYPENLSFGSSHKAFYLAGIEHETYGYPIIDGDKSGHVLSFLSVSNTIVVDGFDIQNGLSDKGGGMYIYDCSPIIMNCEFRINSAYNADGPAYGGGLCIEYGSPIIYKCDINHNYADSDDPSYDGVGGGIATYYSPATFTECNIGIDWLNRADNMYAGEIYDATPNANYVPCYNDCPVRGGNAATSPYSSYIYTPNIDCDE